MDDSTFGEPPRDSSGMQRVKLYRLTPDGLWDEKGTGSVSVEYMEQSGAVGLVIIAENDRRTLLIHRISFEDIYQRQGEDTIITWMDAELETDIALSFQEENGCNVIWDQIQEVQKHAQESMPPSDAPDAAESFLVPPSDDSIEPMIGPHPSPDFWEAKGISLNAEELPPPELRHLSRIAAVLQDASPFSRDRIAEQAMVPNYLRRLLDIFHDLEDLEDTAGLHSMYSVVRNFIMLNDTMLLETLVNEENVMDVVGALEYDPEQTARQQHREFLRDKVVFREVIPITDPSVRAKIHQTYRVGYLKDVILPKVLDDGTFATLSSLMMFNNVEVLVALTHSATFFPDLFRRLNIESGATTTAADAEWEDHVSFLQELCGMAKHLQVSNRNQMLHKLISLGLFRVMAAALERPSDSLRLRAMDVLLAAAQHDPGLIRAYIEAGSEQGRLLEFLIKTLADISQGGLQEQALELLRVILSFGEPGDGPAEQSSFLELFYEKHMKRALQTLITGAAANVEDGGAPASSLVVVMELLCFCTSRHGMRIKYFILRSQSNPTPVEAVLKLLGRREPWLALAAVRFLRTCVGLKDEFYFRYLMRNKVFEPVVSAFLANGSRYNLLNSAVLELFDFIRMENNKSLVAHLVENYGERLAGVDYVDTFSALRLKYDQAQDRSGGVSNDVTSAAQAALEQQRTRPDERAPTKDEEDYFGEGDDEEAPPAPAPSPANSEGVPPSTPRPGQLAGLVDYGDDDDDDAAAAVHSAAAPQSPPGSPDSNSSMTSSGSAKRGAPSVGVPELETATKRLRGADHGQSSSPGLTRSISLPRRIDRPLGQGPHSPRVEGSLSSANGRREPGRATHSGGSMAESNSASDSYAGQRSAVRGHDDAQPPLSGKSAPWAETGRSVSPSSRGSSGSSSGGGSGSGSSSSGSSSGSSSSDDSDRDRRNSSPSRAQRVDSDGEPGGLKGMPHRNSSPSSSPARHKSSVLPDSATHDGDGRSTDQNQPPSLNGVDDQGSSWVSASPTSPWHSSRTPSTSPPHGSTNNHDSPRSAPSDAPVSLGRVAHQTGHTEQSPATREGFKGGASTGEGTPLQFHLPSQIRAATFRRSLKSNGRPPSHTSPNSPRVSSSSG